MIEIKELLAKAQNNKDFTKFKKENPDFYLAHCFVMTNVDDEDLGWELGYYSPKKDKLVVLETKPKLHIREEEDVFKKEGTVKELKIEDVQVTVARAYEITDTLMKEKYSSQAATKRIILLQNIEKPTYNITLVTRSFNILNIRIDAATGEVMSHNLQSIMGLGKRE